jgi:hypothetical protein
MKSDDLEELEATEQLRVREDYRMALPLYRYEVTLANGTTYLANNVHAEVLQAGSVAYFEVTLTDCWTWNRARPARTVGKVMIHTFATITIEDMKPV